ncbi:MAG: hypothetical protein ACTSSI_16970 [Candidatus Helarchaeota archaeon]
MKTKKIENGIKIFIYDNKICQVPEDGGFELEIKHRQNALEIDIIHVYGDHVGPVFKGQFKTQFKSESYENISVDLFSNSKSNIDLFCGCNSRNDELHVTFHTNDPESDEIISTKDFTYQDIGDMANDS